VRNLGDDTDAKEISATSSRGWGLRILTSVGLNPLSDTNGNGVIDTGPLGPGQSLGIIVEISLPTRAEKDARDTTVVTASSAQGAEAGEVDSATDTTTVNGFIALSLSTSSVAFGEVDPIGFVPPSGPGGLTSVADSLGAYYVKSGALQVTVDSNAAWSAFVRAEENLGTASTIRIAEGDLQWRLVGASNWADLSSETSVLLAAGSAGVSSYQYDYRLRVLWVDDPGSFDSMMTFEVAQ
jgi:hypothetical protein